MSPTKTRIVSCDASRIGLLATTSQSGDILDELVVRLDLSAEDAQHVKTAAELLQTSDIPVAFPTETVYGLGADATRSAAVKGIYKAKQRPSDNPLIVHFASLRQLRSVLRGHARTQQDEPLGPVDNSDPIPGIYKPLIARFWPGPLTIILPNSANSPLAPEVTAGLRTFGARIPRHPLALALIQSADVPVAAPSANASTKPSPTAAEHVEHDLDGRIDIIIDGGPCAVGVESTVVDGLSLPPMILRPGGVSLEQIRGCPGWEDIQIGYRNIAEQGSQPRAPGMKYRHYSPKATVILFECGREPPTFEALQKHLGPLRRCGIVRTKSWTLAGTNILPLVKSQRRANNLHKTLNDTESILSQPGFAGMLQTMHEERSAKAKPVRQSVLIDGTRLDILDVDLGPVTANIARGIFSALRDLDRERVEAIFVEGIDDEEGNTAAAIMNRLRKAAEVRVEG